MANLAERLREARRSAGFESAAAAARKFGWTPATYRHHENGTRNFDRDFAKQYARSFKVNATWLLGLSEDKDKSLLEGLRDQLLISDDYYGSLADLNETIKEEVSSSLVRVADMRDIQSKGVYALFGATSQYQVFPIGLLNALSKSRWKDITALVAVEDHMAPTIKIGATLLLDPGNTEPVEQDAIWLFSFGGLIAIRRLRFETATECLAIADAPHISDWAIDTRSGEFFILAKVVWVGQIV